eukprot:1964643-Amphidinium_carterae.1
MPQEQPAHLRVRSDSDWRMLSKQALYERYIILPRATPTLCFTYNSDCHCFKLGSSGDLGVAVNERCSSTWTPVQALLLPHEEVQ